MPLCGWENPSDRRGDIIRAEHSLQTTFRGGNRRTHIRFVLPEAYIWDRSVHSPAFHERRSRLKPPLAVSRLAQYRGMNMRIGPTNRLLPWVGALLLALDPTSLVHAQQKTPTGTTPSATTTGATGLPTLPTLTPAEDAQLMTDAEMLVTLVFGFLGVTPTATELTEFTSLIYQLLVFLTILQKLGAMFPPTAP